MIESLFSLAGKTAVVIGGTGELCGAMAGALAMAGAEVVIAGRSEAKATEKIALLAEAGGKSHVVKIDGSVRSDIEKLLDETINLTGRCDILINGAGTNSATPFLEIPEEEYDQILTVNTKSLFQACQVFGRYFIDNQINASIINVGSMSGVIPLSRVFTYSMSKAAVHNLSKNLAREWADQGIRVNTLVPGFFPAEQNRKVLTKERVDSILNHTPMKRFGDKDELAGAVLLLASQAGAFITGAEIVVDGGYSAMTI